MSMSVVIPTKGRVDGVAHVLAQTASFGVARLVVDDGSDPDDARGLAELCEEHGATLVRLPTNRGPSAARNAGAAAATTEVVCFCDSDLEVIPADLPVLLAHFDDPAVGVVAPRIGVGGAPGVLGAYERSSSPLDLGPNPADVVPRGQVSFIPTACVLARRELASTFDESLLVAEDVDWAWTLVEAGWIVRYDPRVVVLHPVRASLAAFLRQRRFYGSGAGPIAARHGDAVAPIVTSGWTASAIAATLAGFPLAGVGLLGVATAALAKRLRGVVREPVRAATSLVVRGSLGATPSLLRQVLRTYGPLLVLVAPRSKLARRILVVGTLSTAIPRWRRNARGQVAPTTFVALQLADDLAYATGMLQAGSRRETRGALRPSLTWFGTKPTAE